MHPVLAAVVKGLAAVGADEAPLVPLVGGQVALIVLRTGQLGRAHGTSVRFDDRRLGTRDSVLTPLMVLEDVCAAEAFLASAAGQRRCLKRICHASVSQIECIERFIIEMCHHQRAHCACQVALLFFISRRPVSFYYARVLKLLRLISVYCVFKSPWMMMQLGPLVIPDIMLPHWIFLRLFISLVLSSYMS